MEAVLSAIFHKNVELNLTQSGTIFEEVLDNNYTFKISHVGPNKNLDISINGNKTYVVSYNPDNDYYANFSAVSDKLKNQTEQAYNK